MNFAINKNTNLILNINNVINGGTSGAWTIVSNTLVHSSTIPSYIDNIYDFLEVGKSYRITYNGDWTSCDYRVYLGDTAGTIRNSSGTHVEVLTFTGEIKRLRFWSNGEVVISSIKIEELQTIVTDNIIELDDINVIENKSFTLSYSPVAKQYISFHSYLPNNYINLPNSLITKRNDTQLKEFNNGDYGKYFDNDIKTFIIESIFNDAPLNTKVFDNITVNLKSDLNGVSTNKFFDKLVLNTEYQCSGEIILNLSNLTKKERNWCINKFSDITNNTNNTLFSTAWDDVKNIYPIDKVVNTDKINTNKPWYQRGRFRDKFLCVRFIENNLENQKIIVNFVSSIFRPSQR